MPRSSLFIGLASAIAVIFIWSGFMVFSRAGVTSGLTPYDVAGLRLIVAASLSLPFIWHWWPRHLPVHALVIMAVCGPGAVYGLLVFHGFTQASAAYGGTFANGSLPIFTTIIAYLFSRQVPGVMQFIAIAVIVTGGVLLGYRGMTAGGANVVFGISLFLIASAVLSVYIYGVSRWQLTPLQALALVNAPNAVVYLPLWILFLPSTLADAGMSTIVFQALFQGIGPGFLALILFALAALHLGPTPTAGFSASVPAAAALFAIPVLGEIPSPLEWLGIATVSLGLGLMVVRRQSPSRAMTDR